ncbi:MAG: MarR family transcriptional regulator [Candidatus Thorarchaeota archaeon]
MAEENVLDKILIKLNELDKKIDDVNSRLGQLEHSQQSSQAQMKINRDIQTMTQGQQLALHYETTSLESELLSFLSPAHVDMLRVLASGINEPWAVYQLKEKMGISRTYVHTLLEQLERVGLVKRIPNLNKLSFFDYDENTSNTGSNKNTDKKSCPEPKAVTPRHLFTLNTSFDFPPELTNFIPELKNM